MCAVSTLSTLHAKTALPLLRHNGDERTGRLPSRRHSLTHRGMALAAVRADGNKLALS